MEAAPTPSTGSLDVFGLDLDRLNSLDVRSAEQRVVTAAERPSETEVAAAERAIEERAQQARAEAKQAQAARETRPEGGRAQRQPSPAAAAFSQKLREAIAQEIQAQELERSTLGLEDPATLAGVRLERRQRIEGEKDVRSLAGRFSVAPLVVPRPDGAAALPKEVLVALARLDRAYEDSRNPRSLAAWSAENANFLKTQDWARRDRAVAARDDVLERESAFTRLIADANELAGSGSTQLAGDIESRLDEVAPESREQAGDIALIALENPAVREQAAKEVTAILTVTAPPPPTPRPLPELTESVVALGTQLSEKAGFPPMLEEHKRLGVQVDAIDEQLKQGLPEQRRKDLVDKRLAMVTRRNALQEQMLTTEPDPETWSELVASSDELIRRHQLDSGARAAVYAGRVDALKADEQKGFPDAPSRWRFLDDQREVISLLEKARPGNDPLDGLVLPDTYGLQLLKQAKADLQKEQAAAAAAAAAAAKKKPPTVAKKPQAKPQPKPKPKPKPPPKKQKPPPKKKKKKK